MKQTITSKTYAKRKSTVRRSPSKRGKKGGRKIPLFFPLLVCLGVLLAIILYLHLGQPPPTFTEKQRTLEQLLRTQLVQLKVPQGAIHKQGEEHRSGGKTWTLSRWEITLPSGVAPEEAASQLLRRIQDACPGGGVRSTESRTQYGAWEIEIKIDTLLAHHLILRLPTIQPPPPIRPAPRIAIVVDDLGSDTRVAEEILRLDAPLTFSIFPLQPSSRRIAHKAHAKGREIILHLPMEPRGYPLNDPGKGALFVSMDEKELLRQLRKDLEAVPFITGINNHMGSRFMEHGEKVRLVLKELKQRDLFFLDSRTTSKSQGYDIAQDLALRADTRDLFLDNESDVGYTKLQLEHLIHIARDHGTAIGICHPYPSTITALKEMIPQIKAEGIEIVPLSQALDE
jgi:polysaccharide deacetylase 2 family uncharacterized protein YibQ